MNITIVAKCNKFGNEFHIYDFAFHIKTHIFAITSLGFLLNIAKILN